MKTITLPLFTLLLLPLALAETGCFLEKDSSFYCQTIDQEQAIEECQLKQCNLEKSFISNTPCSPENVPECEQILCKSSCQNDFAGNCRSGQIPEENKDEWCTPICCVYFIDEKISCTSQFRQGICESQAKNKNLDSYYTLPTDKQSCETICETKINALEDLNTNNFIKHHIFISSKQNTTTTTSKTKPSPPVITTDELPKSTEKSSSTGIIFFFILILMAALGYYLYIQKKITFKLENPFKSQSPTLPSSPSKPTSRTITPLSFKITSQSQVLKQQHQTKVKEHERDDFFHLFGEFATKAQYEGSHLKTLKNIIELYEKKQFTIPKKPTSQQQKAIDLLENFITKTKQQPLTEHSNPSEPLKSSKPPTLYLSPSEKKKKQELDTVLNALRELSKNP
jgi:hypothetical protein